MGLNEKIFGMELICHPWRCIEFNNVPSDEYQSITARYTIEDRYRKDYQDHVTNLSILYALKYNKFGWGMTHHANGDLSIRALVKDKVITEEDQYDPDCLIE